MSRFPGLLLLLLAALAPSAAPGAAANGVPDDSGACLGGASRSLIVAMPRVPIAPQRAWRGICFRFTTGSDYQRLDWLENGKVDVALLSPFALSLLEESAGDEFCAAGGAFAAVAPPAHRYLLRRIGGGDTPKPPRQALLDSLREDRSTVPIVVDSHLSDGLIQLVEATAGWLEAGGGADLELWRRFRDRLRFAGVPSPAGDGPGARPARFEVVRVVDRGGDRGFAGCADPMSECLGAGAQTDLLVARRAGLPGALAAAGCEPVSAPGWQDRLPAAWAPDHPMRVFLARNLEPHQRGFLTRRHYRFTLDEIWSILREEGSGGGAEGLSLVLTGGGVKAGYQTELVDQLYRRGYLYNRLAEEPAERRALRVDSIVGTSGGALLGVFVAAIDWWREGRAEIGASLVDTLWRQGGEYLESEDIFPSIDMLRFASLLWSGLVFGLVCAVALLFKPLRARLLPAAAPARQDAADGGRNRWSTLPWIALLGLSPWVIKGITGDTGLEHIPAVSGLFYSGYIFLAIYSDQRHVFDGKAAVVDRRRSTLWLCAAGALLTLGPFLIPAGHPLRRDPLELPMLGFVTVPTVVVAAGLLVLAWAIHRQAAARASTVDPRKLRAAAGLMVFVPLVGYAALLPTPVELFELSPGFWLWLTVAIVVVTVGALVLGRSGRAPRRLGAWIGGGLDVLLAKHPSRSLLGMRRSSRALAGFCCAWMWWNFVSAPALYGNDQAKSYFQQTLAAFVGAESVDEEACDVRFRAPLIITATSLSRGREVYYLAEPDAAGALAERPEIASDPRWVSVGPVVTNGALGALAFASGSPFPVFPMTRVDPTPIARQCPGAGAAPVFDPHGAAEEWLIDGGYAHNMPIDAARQLGGRRVLVLSSSPLHHDEPGGGGVDAAPEGPSWFSIGRLVLGAPRLIPYLYTRSQVEDALGTEDLLVAALSPVVPAEERWPLLVDFDEGPLSLVIERARANLGSDARIGSIESWGQPDCRLTGVPVACAELRRGPIAP